MPPSYYTYDEQYPSGLNTPGPSPAFEWEDTSEWPKTFTYNAPNTGYQGYHPPAPVYQSNQPAASQYYYNNQVSTETHLENLDMSLTSGHHNRLHTTPMVPTTPSLKLPHLVGPTILLTTQPHPPTTASPTFKAHSRKLQALTITLVS
jgi:hypothetical protein